MLVNTEDLEIMYGKQVAQYPICRLGSEYVPLFVIDAVVIFETSFKFSLPPNTFPANLTKRMVFANCWNQSFGLDQRLQKEPLLEV